MFGFIKKIIHNGGDLSNPTQEIETGWQIKAIGGEDEGRVVPLKYAYIYLGRKDKNRKEKCENSIRFEEQSVSYNQAHFRWHEEEKKFGITHDRKPVVNYTNVNSVPLNPGEEVLLEANDVVRMGNLVFRMSKVRQKAAELPPAESLMEGEDMGETRQSEGLLFSKILESSKPAVNNLELFEDNGGLNTGYSLKVIEGPDKGSDTVFIVNKELTHIGRILPGKEDFQRDMLLSDGTVSKSQAELFWNPLSRFLEIRHNKNARNFTRVIRDGVEDSLLLNPDKPEPLKDNDIILLGQTQILVSHKPAGGISESADEAEQPVPEPSAEAEDLEILGSEPEDFGAQVSAGDEKPYIPPPIQAPIGRDEYLAGRIREMKTRTEKTSDETVSVGQETEDESEKVKKATKTDDKAKKTKSLKALFKPRKTIGVRKNDSWKTDTIELETPFGDRSPGLEDLGEKEVGGKTVELKEPAGLAELEEPEQAEEEIMMPLKKKMSPRQNSPVLNKPITEIVNPDLEDFGS